MQENQLLAFLNCQPFEPFIITLVGGREIAVHHPEYVLPTRAGMGLWLFYDSGHVEALDTALMLSLKSIKPTDFTKLTG